jgi:hypothetical protein
MKTPEIVRLSTPWGRFQDKLRQLHNSSTQYASIEDLKLPFREQLHPLSDAGRRDRARPDAVKNHNAFGHWQALRS